MSDQIHPIARAILGDAGTEKDRQIPCKVCGKPTNLPGFIVNSLKQWNHHVDRLAQDGRASSADLMRISDVEVACDGPCTATLYRQRHDAEAERHAETLALWNLLIHQDSYTPESLALLRARGYARNVERYFARKDKPKPIADRFTKGTYGRDGD